VSNLEPDSATFARWLSTLGDVARRELAQLDRAPAVGVLGSSALEIANRVSVPIDEAPIEGGIERIAEILADAAGAGFRPNGPGYLAYVPGGGLPAAAVADFTTNLLNRYTGIAGAAPALCRLEADVLDWLARAFGYGPEARGILTSGGSLANFSAIVTARHALLGDEGDYRHAIVYTSSEAHHSVAKAVSLAGVPRGNVRIVATDDRLRLRPDALVQAIASDRAAGRRPFLLVSAAGTTNTGAIDPLAELSRVCRDDGLWHHVDGAYGGAFVLCDEGRERLGGIEQADSITFDPHKGLFLPYGTGCLLVRDGARLRDAHGAEAPYLQDLDLAAALPPSPADHGPELSRPYRGLRLWLPLVLHGASAFREALAEKLALAQRFHDRLAEAVEGGLSVELVDRPQLSTVAFRLRRRSGEALASWNARNADWLAAIHARGRVWLSSTMLPVRDGSSFTLRICILSFRTRAAAIDACLEDVAATTDLG
jgi:aromatic-L-amino-acid/L-tryptophan decarboxylase